MAGLIEREARERAAQRLKNAGYVLYRLCPSCPDQAALIVAFDCPVCLGQGRVRLGSAALSLYDPEVVAEALEIGLAETAAVEQEGALGGVDAMLESMATAGLIHRQATVTPRMFRLCPACATRHHQVVDPNCVVCQGTGQLIFGADVLAIHEPVTVGEALGIALEAVARETDQSTLLGEDRVTPIIETLVVLATAGIIDYTAPAHSPLVTGTVTKTTTLIIGKRHQPRPLTHGEQLAFDFTGVWPQPHDRRVISTRAHVYTEDDRPHARGLPAMSDSGHPSHLARLCDPAEPGTNTRLQVRTRRTNHRQAEALIEAAHIATKRKNRKSLKARKRNAAEGN